MLVSSEMARGWESKAVESQQQDARDAKRSGRALTSEERRHQERRSLLELARASAQSELRAACRPAHREMLRMKLEAIQAELAVIGSGSG
jgi:hypothetical protein